MVKTIIQEYVKSGTGKPANKTNKELLASARSRAQKWAQNLPNTKPQEFNKLNRTSDYSSYSEG